MSSNPPNTPKGTKGTNRTDPRRQKIAAARAALAAKQRRKRRIYVAVSVVAVLLIAAIVGIAVQTSRDDSGPVVLPATATGDDNGIVGGDPAAPVTLDVYEDFQCPVCGQLEKASGDTINQLAEDGKARVVYHVMSFLGPESERAANAAAAAADQGKFAAYHDVLFANQPPEQTGGYTNETLIDLGRQVGLTSQQFVDAVNAGTFDGYVAEVDDSASKRGVTGTPTLFLEGQRLSGDQLLPKGLTAAVNAAS